jgi:hypothetical protein
VELGSDKYNDIVKESKVSRVYQLTTNSYRQDTLKPEIWEVSTVINRLK